MAQPNSSPNTIADLDPVPSAPAASDRGAALRITHFDQWQLNDPTGASFTWICLVDIYADPTAA